MTEAAPLRVAQVICTDAFAGAERYVATLSRSLDAAGCAVVVIGGSRERLPVELAGSGVDWRAGSTVAGAVASLLQAGKFDIVHAHMTAAELAAKVARPRTHARTICTRHFAQRRGSSAPARLVGRTLVKSMDRQIAISEFVARAIDGPSVVIEPGVPSPDETSPPKREPIVLLAQRLEPEKRTDVALRMWAASRLAEQGWRLRLAGDGSQRQTLKQLADSLQVADSVDFLGASHDVDSLLAQASIFLATRPDEPFGLSVVEAMASGLPVLAARGGGHDETVGRSSRAMMFAIDDPSAGAVMLSELAADSALRDAYGAELRDIQRVRFTVDRQATLMIEQYRSIQAERAPAG